ncbi:hypothetical protein [Congregicoccus parvus]|uniref:hypothetical protein n=1 Tax=Congregicoccus parvus TaxID=3081749 RepID=UPI003FA5262D
MKKIHTSAFVCFRCRKVFKRRTHLLCGAKTKPIAHSSSCPDCMQSMVEVGDTFRAPAIDSVEKWTALEKDVLAGRRFTRDEAWGSPTHVFHERKPKGVRSLFQLPSRKRKKKAAQPGATDNPDDAQRLREDH